MKNLPVDLISSVLVEIRIVGKRIAASIKTMVTPRIAYNNFLPLVG